MRTSRRMDDNCADAVSRTSPLSSMQRLISAISDPLRLDGICDGRKLRVNAAEPRERTLDVAPTLQGVANFQKCLRLQLAAPRRQVRSFTHIARTTDSKLVVLIQRLTRLRGLGQTTLHLAYL